MYRPFEHAQKDINEMIEYWDRTTLSLRRPPTPSEKSEEDQQHHPQSGKAVGLDGIPNEFLKFGGDVMITSFTNLFITVSDLEQTSSDWQKG
jgi:hypothetical protein